MSTHRRRAHRGGHEDNADRWLLTYADMITLLLALFIILFSMSSISEKKFLEFKLGLQEVFSPNAVSVPGASGLLQQTSLVERASTAAAAQLATPFESTGKESVVTTQLARIAQQIQRALASHGLATAASVTVSTKGVVVQILADKAFFATDSAALGQVGNEVVDTIAGVVRNDPNNLVVEGYTDDEPITGGPYDSNWELSAVRAANVANRLDITDGIASTRLSAQGYGETNPIDSNATPAGRAQNRRVDVVILSTQEVS